MVIIDEEKYEELLSCVGTSLVEIDEEEVDAMNKEIADKVCADWEEIDKLGERWTSYIVNDECCGMASNRNDSAVDLMIAVQMSVYPRTVTWVDVESAIEDWRKARKPDRSDVSEFTDHLKRVYQYIDGWAFRKYMDSPHNVMQNKSDLWKRVSYQCCANGYGTNWLNCVMVPEPLALRDYAIESIGYNGAPTDSDIEEHLADGNVGKITLDMVKEAFAKEQEEKEND